MKSELLDLKHKETDYYQKKDLQNTQFKDIAIEMENEFVEMMVKLEVIKSPSSRF